jgi:hypothetical protein
MPVQCWLRCLPLLQQPRRAVLETPRPSSCCIAGSSRLEKGTPSFVNDFIKPYVLRRAGNLQAWIIEAKVKSTRAVCHELETRNGPRVSRRGPSTQFRRKVTCIQLHALPWSLLLLLHLCCEGCSPDLRREWIAQHRMCRPFSCVQTIHMLL